MEAHGAPLTSGRDWKYGRFLTIAVDQSTEGASGCSIDGLYRALKALEPQLGASLVTSGLVFYGMQKVKSNPLTATFRVARRAGTNPPDTRVFDPTVVTLGEWRARFELTREKSWHAGLLQEKQTA